MKTNKTIKRTTRQIIAEEVVDNTPVYTHEGAVASNIGYFSELKRSVCACMLFEKSFYEDGISISERVSDLIGKVSPEKVAELAIKCRTEMKLRHMPLFMATQMWKYATHKKHVSNVLANVIQRADEPAEVLSMWFKMQNIAANAKKTIPNQFKKGINKAFEKFSEYQLSKYKGNGKEVSLKDVILLTHPKRTEIFKKVIEGTIEPPMTWEVEYSKAGNDIEKKKAIWLKLISEKKLGALAFLRNLRNMIGVGVSENVMRDGLKQINTERVLPFRFIQASKYAPFLNAELEECMFKCLEKHDRMGGKTVFLVDVSGSMDAKISDKSDLLRLECAGAVAMLLREIVGDTFRVFTFSERTVEVPNRRGFALNDAISNSQEHSSTYLGSALKHINATVKDYDRIIVITDEQSHDSITTSPVGKANGYIINVAAYKNGVGYDNYVHISGWSEAVIDYIMEYEKNFCK